MHVVLLVRRTLALIIGGIKAFFVAAAADPVLPVTYGASESDAARPPRLRQRTAHASELAINAPAAALRMTTSQGGVCHMNSSRNAAIASAKSPALVMPTVHTG